jgi:hypothetical protein
MHPEAASRYRVLFGECQPPKPEHRLQRLSSESSPSVLAPGNVNATLTLLFTTILLLPRWRGRAATEKNPK